MERQRVGLFGSTGSIGSSTLDVLARHPERFSVEVLAAHSRVEPLFEQIKRFRPATVGLVDGDRRAALEERLTSLPSSQRPTVVTGQAAVDELAGTANLDIVVAAVVGTAGLRSTWNALAAGKRVLLANKESLVAAGELMLDVARQGGATLLPIDSEHNAIFQCLPAEQAALVGRAGVVEENRDIERLVLTASGGPFRDRPLDDFAAISPEEACAHPNWSMGRKISVDSATMMNKGLEVIEAARLFGVCAERIEVLVHPESVIHSMVRFVDGSVIAELGEPDMRTPIAHALAWPDRIDSGVAPLDFGALAGLHFEAPDPERFPALRLAFEALAAGGSMPLVLNAANEVAVESFLDGRIGFMAIPAAIEAAMAHFAETGGPPLPSSIDAVLDADRAVRDWTATWCSSSPDRVAG
ncbi:1-deoxy-D-xylulose-5-phosphate reductoisomerase [Guyparkeria hydrothermalis]|uniref:1-deoxy-D-xylulose-5-phosphate reductoisomerase n=1 Tax=Guyparkeria hydrothermalis TaxID=923 RepID=UPI0020206C27|nr:1-deoxy-D-xylulose-5-phosphate reductoisomerase [Guyparkeria hydrothermalis]MCL7744487.1 1-deoxy-D-xylulose-5-phosphate reductoisomerase [Guyparkeria hydrothermalis]